jgi:lysophospholipase
MQTAPFDGNSLTSDRARYERSLAVVMAEPSLGIGGPTIGWLNAAMRAACRISEPDLIEAFPIPVLMLLAGAETIVSNQASENISRRLKTAAHLRIPSSRHEILMERDEIRDQFWIAFDAFIQGRT